MVEIYRTPQDIAKELRISVDVARRAFEALPGVVHVRRGRRKLIRIPEGVYLAWRAERTVKAG